MKYTNTTFTRYLSLDSPFLRGNDDQALHARLGVPVGQCDDVFGPSTQRAVIAFQKNNRLIADGVVSKERWGDHNQAFGVMQIDKRAHELEGLPDPKSVAHIEQAAGILCANLERIAEIHENWEPPFILKGAVVANNSGINNVRTKDKMDEGITGDDYGSDVIARAQYYIQHEELSVFRQ
jgi:peptidoglycan hydrolase-like protein with peptidoglycan-binding domain